MVELVDTRDLKSLGLIAVRVRVPFRAPASEAPSLMRRGFAFSSPFPVPRYAFLRPSRRFPPSLATLPSVPHDAFLRPSRRFPPSLTTLPSVPHDASLRPSRRFPPSLATLPSVPRPSRFASLPRRDRIKPPWDSREALFVPPPQKGRGLGEWVIT